MRELTGEELNLRLLLPEVNCGFSAIDESGIKKEPIKVPTLSLTRRVVVIVA